MAKFSLKWLFVGVALVGGMLAGARSCITNLRTTFDMDYVEVLQEFDLGSGRRLALTRKPNNDISVPFNALFYDPNRIVFGDMLATSWDDSWRGEKGKLLRFEVVQDGDLFGLVETSAPTVLLTLHDFSQGVRWDSCGIHNQPGWEDQAAVLLGKKSGKTLTLSPCGTNVLDRWKPSTP